LENFNLKSAENIPTPDTIKAECSRVISLGFSSGWLNECKDTPYNFIFSDGVPITETNKTPTTPQPPDAGAGDAAGRKQANAEQEMVIQAQAKVICDLNEENNNLKRNNAILAAKDGGENPGLTMPSHKIPQKRKVIAKALSLSEKQAGRICKQVEAGKPPKKYRDCPFYGSLKDIETWYWEHFGKREVRGCLDDMRNDSDDSDDSQDENFSINNRKTDNDYKKHFDTEK